MATVNMLYDVEAERSVLGSMLMDKEACVLAANQLEDEDFYDGRHRVIFSTIKDMVNNNTAVDMITLNERLSGNKLFGADSLNAVKEIAFAVSTSVNLPQYIKILTEKTYRRKSYQLAENIKTAAMEKGISKLNDAVDELSNNVMKTSELTSADKVLEEVFKDMTKPNKKKISGLTTGFTKIDVMTGGLQPTDLIVIAARPSMGKTALLLDIVRNGTKALLKEDKITVFFSLEMSKKQLGTRFFTAETEIPNDNFRMDMLTVEQRQKLIESAKVIEEFSKNMYINDEMGVSTSDIYSMCHTIRAKTGKDIGLIAIDYLQLIETAGVNRNQELASVSRALKKLAKNFNCPVIVLSQLNRAVESRADKMPQLSDLRDSGAIEQDADVVILMMREDYYFPESEKPGVTDINIAKQRNGRTGRIDLMFRNDITSFRNIKR